MQTVWIILMINPSTCLRGFLFGLPNVAADSSFFVTSHFSPYSGGKGFCRNNELSSTGIKTSIACTGTCIERINDGQSCSRDTLKIMDLDPMLIGESGDDDACKSGLCQCGTCARYGRVRLSLIDLRWLIFRFVQLLWNTYVPLMLLWYSSVRTATSHIFFLRSGWSLFEKCRL